MMNRSEKENASSVFNEGSMGPAIFQELMTAAINNFWRKVKFLFLAFVKLLKATQSKNLRKANFYKWSRLDIEDID